MTVDNHQEPEETEGRPPPLRAGVEDAYLAENIRDARRRAGMSQGELARHMAGLGWPWHQQTVRRNEEGTRKISAGELAALARIFSTSADRLMMPGDESTAAALLEQSAAGAHVAWERIARWAESLAAAQRQLTRTVREAGAADFSGSRVITEKLAAAREALALTAESAVAAADTDSRAEDERY